jgi:hypothetical protein
MEKSFTCTLTTKPWPGYLTSRTWRSRQHGGPSVYRSETLHLSTVTVGSKTSGLYIHSRTAWCSAMWRRWSIWRRWFRCTRGIGSRGYQSSCWPIDHRPTRPQVRRLLPWCSGGNFACPVTLFGARPDREQSQTDYAADLVERLHDIHLYARQHLKVSSDRMKARYDRLANSAGF